MNINHDPPSIPSTVELRRKENFRFWIIFSIIFWPLLPVGFIIYALLSRLGSAKVKQRLRLGVASLFRLWITHPLYVMKIALKRKNLRIIVAVLLLFPTLLTVFWGVFFGGWTSLDEMSFTNEVLLSPDRHLPMGTDEQGRNIFTQIAAGARHSYLSSLIAVVIAVGFGLMIGSAAGNERLAGAISFWIQLLETIPLLIILMVIFALFSDWSSSLDSTVAKDLLRILVLGVCLGTGLSPPAIRLVRDKIFAFISEDFVSATKAHGIKQREIIWRHIIQKNILSDLLVLAVQIWGFAMLMEISLSYVFSIGSAKLGGEPYHSWAWMLLTPASKNALIGNVDNILESWWLWSFPIYFICSTIVGLYLFGDGLKQWRSKIGQYDIVDTHSPFENILLSRTGMD